MKFLSCLAAFYLSITTAYAQGIELGRDNSGTVFVWKNSEAYSKVIKLIQSGVHKSNPTLVMQQLSCMADPGDKAVITDAGFASHTIMVTSGKSAGCEGVIAMEDVKR